MEVGFRPVEEQDTLESHNYHMKRIILRESELVNLIKRVINEQSTPCKKILASQCVTQGGSMYYETPMNVCATINGVPANNSHVGQVIESPNPNNPNLMEIIQVTNITSTAQQPTTTIDHNTSSQPCTTNATGCVPGYNMCMKDCSELVPSSFATLIANKPCNWLTNRMTAFLNKMTSMSDPCNCQHKRVQCKLNMVKQLVVQNGC